MEPPVSEEVARSRWMMINAVRLGGAAMVVIGILGLRGVFEYPAIAGYILVGAGLIEIFLIPQLLARSWRSPLE